MNALRRKQLEDVNEVLTCAQAILQRVLYEEETAFENRNGSLQSTQSGDASGTAVDIMKETMEMIEQAKDNLDEVIDN